MLANYHLLGWQLCPIPPFEKGPTHSGWNEQWAALPLFADLPPLHNVGLMHLYSGTCCIDIDDSEAASLWLSDRGINLQQLLDADDAVQINSGNPGHGKLIYTAPVGMSLPSKKIMALGKTILEFRCATANGKTVQDVLPPSVHPSGSVYQWAGKGDYNNLPLLPEALLEVWSTLHDSDKKTNLPVNDVVVPASWEEMKTALYSIKADCPRQVWIECGMAIHDAALTLGRLDDGFAVWTEWSATGGEKYNPSELPAQWKSFKQRNDGIRLATLFHHATNAGWKRPAPDVSAYFKPVTLTTEQVKDTVTMAQRTPVVDVSMWPHTLRARAEEVAHEVGCDPIVPLVAGLSAISAAIDKRTCLKITDTWKVPPTIWLMTIGEPADKKTPGSKPMFSPLKQLEIEDKPRFAAEMLSWTGKEARAAMQQKQYREWQCTVEAELPNAVAPHVEQIGAEPKPLRLIIQDATTQKVVSMASGQPRGFLLWLDEMNRWLTRLGDPRNTDDRGCWIQGYETGSYTMDRQTTGTIQAENLALSMYGNCQPAVFRDNVVAASTDGIVQRFMPVSINPLKNVMWQHSVPDFVSHASEYEGLIRRLYAAPQAEYRMSEAANMLFRDFSEWSLRFRELERTLQSNDTYQTALGKIEGNCCRIMLLFHMIDHPNETFISEQTATQAIELMKRFFIPSLRYAFVEIGNQRDPLGQVIADLMLQYSSVKDTTTLGELRQHVKRVANGRSGLALDTAIRIVMDELTAMGYVAILTDHPRYPVWSINPEIATQFKEQRTKIIKAKQEVIEKISSCMEKEGRPFSKPQYATGYKQMEA